MELSGGIVFGYLFSVPLVYTSVILFRGHVLHDLLFLDSESYGGRSFRSCICLSSLVSAGNLIVAQAFGIRFIVKPFTA